MKYKKLFLMVFSLVCITGVTSFVHMQNRSTGELTLEISSPKSIYKLGEPINFSFELNNHTNETITLLDVFGTGTGYLHLKVSKDGSNFVGSDDPSWGKLDTTGKTYIKPHGSTKTNATILWNLSNQGTAKFKFGEPGIYYFKAYYTAKLEGERLPIKLESEQVQMTIKEPVGEELEVWNKIKNNGDFAYFIQEGDLRLPSYKSEESLKFQKEIEQIISQHPETFYAGLLRQSLDKFRVNEEKMKKNMEKIKPF